VTRRRALVAAALLAALALQLWAIRAQSLIGDAPVHLLAGEQALRYGQNRLNLEHPPLVKLVAALPLLAGPALAPPLAGRDAIRASLALFDDPARLLRVQVASRALLLALFGVPFLLVWWRVGARMVGAPDGERSGVVLALALALALPLVGILAIVQTDTAAALGFGCTLLAALRYVERSQARRALVLGAAVGLAVAAKHSGLLAAPAALLALALAARRVPGRRVAAHLALALVAGLTVAAIPYWIANRHYDSRAGRELLSSYARGEVMPVGDALRAAEPALLAIERRAPSFAQWCAGLAGIRAQDRIGVYLPYAFGRIDSRGFWWYFPAVLAVRLPLALLAASLGAGVAAWRTRRARAARGVLSEEGALALALLLPYAVVALGSSYNLGLRHLLPVLPLLLLPAARWAAARPARAVALVALLAAESFAVAPLWMSATNTWWLGRHNPTRFALTESEGDYRQNFRTLAAALRRRGVTGLGMIYPFLDPREMRAYLPAARRIEPGSALEPGWYALSVRVEQLAPALLGGDWERIHDAAILVPLAERYDALWKELRATAEDHGYVAGTFHLFRVPAP